MCSLLLHCAVQAVASFAIYEAVISSLCRGLILRYLISALLVGCLRQAAQPCNAPVQIHGQVTL